MTQNKDKLCIAFRVDSNKTLGLGHLTRCLSIAEVLSKKGVRCIFLTSNSNKEEIERYGFEIFKVIQNRKEGDEIKKILDKEKCTKFIIDSKRKSILRIIKSLKGKIKIILIDNIQFANDVDLTILPGVHEQFTRCPKNCLSGPEYVLINPKFNQQKLRKKKKKILLSMGGTDKKNVTIRIVSAFKEIESDFKLLIVLGRFYKYEKELLDLVADDKRFTIIKNPSNFPHLMFECTIGIIAFGISVYEAAFSRLPVFVISHSDENDASAKRIEKYGWFRYIGKYDQIKYKDAINEINSSFHNKQLLKKMSSAGSIIDGRGAERISDIILNNIR